MATDSRQKRKGTWMINGGNTEDTTSSSGGCTEAKRRLNKNMQRLKMGSLGENSQEKRRKNILFS